MIEHRVIVETDRLILEAKGTQNFKWVRIKDVPVEREKEIVTSLVQLASLHAQGTDALLYPTEEGFGYLTQEECDEIMQGGKGRKKFDIQLVKALLMEYIGISW